MDHPLGLSNDQLCRLYEDALNCIPAVVPELQKLIKRYPGFPTLKNYLKVAYELRGQHRQSRKVQQEIVTQHPDYLFGKVAATSDALDCDKPEKALEILGRDLDLRKLYPEREVFHISEVKTYYASVAELHCYLGQLDEALGIQAALTKLVPGDQVLKVVESQITYGRAKELHDLMAKEANTAISVTTPRLAGPVTATKRPQFRHAEIAALYEWDLSMPPEIIETLLALPRETLVADLVRVIEDAIARTPYFLEIGEEEADTCFAVHALHFLAELPAPEALPVVLRFLELHEDALSFWLGDFGYSQQFARIGEGGLEEIKAWMKRPGISTSGKSYMASAVEFLALHDPGLCGEALAFFEELLEFFLTCPRTDNILDTGLISYLVGDLITLRAVELEPLIVRIWEKGYIMRSIVGDLESILHELSLPPHPRDVIPYRSLPEQYRKLLRPLDPPALPASDKFESFSARGYGLNPPREDVENVTSFPGRNDPCYCGSGRKFKKCCIPK